MFAESIVHLADTFQDVRQLSSDGDDLLLTGNDVSEETINQAYEQLMNQYYEQWLNDEIPGLNGKTPLEAVRDSDLREMLIEMVKDIENNEERNRVNGRPSFDPTWIGERLGLKANDF
ncbi:MAG: hypothetical protein HY779_01820 [Rubrobacteridae bacterium]|nr:hypothetical protein [Rubrobacteridae bacterium]